MQGTILTGGSARHRVAGMGALLFILRAGTFAQTVPSLDELVDRNIAALGGSERIQALQAITASGRVVGGAMELPVTIYLKRPGLMRMEMSIGGKTVIYGFDGSDTWTINPLTGSEEPKKGDETESQKAREDADEFIFSDLFEYKARGSQLEFSGNEDVHGRPAYKLKLVNRHGTIKYIYLDAETFLESKVTEVRSHASAETAIEAYPSNYQPVAGVTIAYSIEMAKNGKPPMKMLFDKVEADPAIDDSLFKFPAASAASTPEKALAKITPGSIHVRVTEHGYDPPKVEIPANQPVAIAFTRESPSACGA